MRILFWFRHDLRIQDNTGLHAACAAGEVVPCVVLDDAFLKDNPAVGPNRCALFLRAVCSLAEGLEKLGARLIIRHGKPEVEIVKLLKEAKAGSVYVNRDYEEYAVKRDAAVNAAVRHAGGEFVSFKDLVVFESAEILTQAGNPYTMYTQYKNNWLKQEGFPSVIPALRKIPFPAKALQPLKSTPYDFDAVNPESDVPVVTEQSGRARLREFLARDVFDYSPNRDIPALDATSKLSAHLKFGTISPRTVLHAARELRQTLRTAASIKSIQTFISEIVWRDFFFHIITAFPQVTHGSFRPQYEKLKWEYSSERLQAWQEGRTGYPIVDAGMRQLKAIGWMHNRVRMITASFLCKDLLLNWREGERHFTRLLIDGEPAVNNGNWQWVAGTGTDAQPRFRIFNPTEQGKRWDPKGEYVRRWVPELQNVPDDLIHVPWVVQLLCPDYPPPIVDHAAQRLKALAMFKAVSGV